MTLLGGFLDDPMGDVLGDSTGECSTRPMRNVLGDLMGGTILGAVPAPPPPGVLLPTLRSP